MNPTLPWYHAGLRFRCLGCGNCCTGEPGYVWVVQSEIERLAELLSLDVAQFEMQFVRSIGRRKSLIEMPNGDCVFLERPSMRCKVYIARPQQCRTWPFWSTNLRTPEDWAKTAQRCPGAAKGRLYSLGQIHAALEQER
jgi:Fe-S-cluster containining protein